MSFFNWEHVGRISTVSKIVTFKPVDISVPVNISARVMILKWQLSVLSTLNYRKHVLMLYQGSSWRETWEKLSPKTVPLFLCSFFKLREKWFYIGYIERIFQKTRYHFSSKLQKTVKTSPCFKFVGLPLLYIMNRSNFVTIRPWEMNNHGTTVVF